MIVDIRYVDIGAFLVNVHDVVDYLWVVFLIARFFIRLVCALLALRFVFLFSLFGYLVGLVTIAFDRLRADNFTVWVWVASDWHRLLLLKDSWLASIVCPLVRVVVGLVGLHVNFVSLFAFLLLFVQSRPMVLFN